MAAGLDELFRRHWPLVLGYLNRRTGDRSLAEELAQQTFYRATRAFLGWHGGSAEAWLLAIARHLLVDHVRQGNRLVPLPETLIDEAPELETAIAVRDVLARLPESQRRLLELIYVEGYSLAEVAAMTESTPAAIKTALWRARAAFREVYERMIETTTELGVGT